MFSHREGKKKQNAEHSGTTDEKVKDKKEY